MPAGMPSPLYVRYAQLKIETNGGTPVTYEFQCSATSIGLTSEGGDLTSISTLCPDGSFSESAPRTWSLTVTGVQDVESTDSLMLFLIDNVGEEVTATYYPKTDNTGAPVGRGWEGTVTINPPDTVGGAEAGNYATFEAVLPFKGKPTSIDAAGLPVTTAATAPAAAAEPEPQLVDA